MSSDNIVTSNMVTPLTECTKEQQ